MLLKKILRWVTKEPKSRPRLPEVKNIPNMPRVKPPKRRFNFKQDFDRILNEAYAKGFQRELKVSRPDGTAVAMDSHIEAAKGSNTFFNNIIPAQQVMYFANQSFIGYQLCALIAQHWLVSKCCLTPAEDSVRNGYEISVNDGTEVAPEVIDAIKEADVRHNLNGNMIEFVQMGRIFGVRVAMFIIHFDDPDEMREFYKNPFNIDAVKPGSYRGISQIDPYWMTFQFDNAAAGDPSSKNFYEPTWWIVNSLYIHHSHLIIFKTEEVPDILKPTYYYGGIPIPQKIVERVYAAERCANEAPMLLLTKRTSVMKIDITQALAQPDEFNERMGFFTNLHNNYGVKSMGEDEEYQQFDTSLADVDDVIMSQYQLVAAAANVPATKLLGTTPKGFNSTGEKEEADYHEELEGIQSRDLTPLIERHHMLLIKSDIAPEFNIAPFNTAISWLSLDAMTAKEQAEVNKLKSEVDEKLINAGVIDQREARERITKDPDSGYNGLLAEDAVKPEETLTNIDNDYTIA